MNPVARRIGGAAAVAALVLAISLVDWQFWTKYLSRPASPDDLSVQSYGPQVSVPGDYSALPRAESQPRPHFDAAIKMAGDYGSSALLVAVGDELVLERYWGDTDRASLHLTFSFHKTVSALLIGAAIADGFIADVDMPMGELIAEWANDPRGEPSLRSALQMSAGYVHPDFDGGAFSSAANFYYGSDIGKAALSGGILAQGKAAFDYGDRNAQIVGLALQRALPVDYESYLSQRLWQPLGAADARVVKAGPDAPTVTYCCLFAVAEDWAKIGMLLRDGGQFEGQQIIPSDWIEEMMQPSATNPNFGLFLWRGSPFNAERSYTPASPARVNSRQPFAVDDVYFLDGAGGQRVYFSRSLDLVVVRLGAYRSDWDDTALFNAVVSDITANSTRPKGS